LKILDISLNLRYELKAKKKYIWTLIFEDVVSDDEISIYFTIYYKDNFESVDGIRLLIHNPTIVKNEEIYNELNIIFENLFLLSKGWKIFDLFLEEFIEIPFLDSVSQYASMYRAMLENLYAESKAERSLYVKIGRIDLPKILHPVEYVDEIVSLIDKVKDPQIQKFYLYQLSIHLKSSTLTVSQFKKIHQIVNKHENIKDDLCFITKLNLYIDKYNIYRKSTLNKGTTYVKKSLDDRINFSDYMYSLLIEYYYQRGKLGMAIDFALSDLDKYSTEFSKQFIKDNLKKLKTKFRYIIFLKINNTSLIKLLTKEIFEKIIPLSINLLPLLFGFLLFVLPPITDPNTLSFIIDTDFFISILLLEISTILLTSFIFSAISIANGTKGDNSEVKNKKINNSLIIISLILISLFLLPTLYFTSTSITSIGKTEIMGNANKFEYNNIDTIYFNLISPSNECDGSTNKTKISCLYHVRLTSLMRLPLRLLGEYQEPQIIIKEYLRKLNLLKLTKTNIMIQLSGFGKHYLDSLL